jgi:hypothetical protein
VCRWTGSRIHLHVPLRGAYSYSYSYSYTDTDSNSHGDFNSATYSHATARPTPKRTPNTASAPVREVERAVLNALAKGIAALPQDYVRLRRSRSTIAWKASDTDALQ